MSHTRHGWTTFAAVLAACALLSGCSGADDSQSSAAPPTQDQTSQPGEPTDSPPTSSPTTPSTPPPVVLRFSPRSGGKHTDDCQRLVPGDDPAEFLYYPVLVKTPTSLTLDSLETEHTRGVVDAAAWVAPAGPTPETGTFKGWPPPKIVTGDSNLQWSKRVPAKGATLEPGAFYNVFIRLQVDPTPGDSEVKGIQFGFHNEGGVHTITWLGQTTFSMSC
jgi:hypothetical protein